MTVADTKALAAMKAEFDAMKKELAALKDNSHSANTWKPYRDFSFDNRMGRTRLQTLINRELVEVDKSGRSFLYRWKVAA